MLLRVSLLALLAAPAALSAQANRRAANAAPAAAPAAPPPDPSARPGLRSYFSDRRDFTVGDIVTILVDDYTITSAIKDDQAQQRRNKDFGLGIDASMAGGMSKNVDVGITSKNNGSSQARGEARRENRFQSEMSVRVVAVGPNGTLQLKGSRVIDVDKGKQNITLTGWVRPQDISATNVVESSHIADAQLAYASVGDLGKAKQGIVSKIVSIVWP